jgi:hypothetical protein
MRKPNQITGRAEINPGREDRADGPRHCERVGGYYAGMRTGWEMWAQTNLGPGQHFPGERPAKRK